MAASDEEIKPTKRNKRKFNTDMKLPKLAIMFCLMFNFFLLILNLVSTDTLWCTYIYVCVCVCLNTCNEKVK